MSDIYYPPSDQNDWLNTLPVKEDPKDLDYFDNLFKEFFGPQATFVITEKDVNDEC